ncbi:hypothetical protein [Mesorhizobium sp. B2-1-3A]|uniref:hypothetical protein n=1 Tax=Mesorhizobium sp. B2-1-3A TaxID=2589971 RepID=UPI00112EBE0C|nr:hypothetical protein [Mesorhizobium sp. B2-1-3A]TPM89879.1 hypothetical protein FJ977_35480 [Mesorhizobium sp. B2-1-3A]
MEHALNEGQLMALQEIALRGSKKPAKAKHKAGYVKPPEIPVVRENVAVLLRDGLVRSMGPHSKVVRISEKGLAVLEAYMSRIKTKFDPRPMPRIEVARPVADLCIEVRWIGGTRIGRTEIVDLSPAINKYRVYAPLRNDRSLFETLSVGNDGTILEWGDGAFDMTATSVEHLAQDIFRADALSSSTRGGEHG